MRRKVTSPRKTGYGKCCCAGKRRAGGWPNGWGQASPARTNCWLRKIFTRKLPTLTDADIHAALTRPIWPDRGALTVFDAVITGEKFYFYQPSEGYLYTGPRAALAGFLLERGIKADPDVIYRSLLTVQPAAGEKYLVDNTGTGYSIYIVKQSEGLLVPTVRQDYDPGLNLREKVFYDALARPYLFVKQEGLVEAGGFSLPERLKALDTKNGYSVTVEFQKYIVNPEDAGGDFTIQGGEFKGIREVE